MSLEYGIGDRVIQIDEGVIGEVIKFYYPTTCAQQTMILCDDGRKYHAPSNTFIKMDEVTKKMRPIPRQVAKLATMLSAQEHAQPTLIPHDYRNVNVAEDMTITIDLEELKKEVSRTNRIELCSVKEGDYDMTKQELMENYTMEQLADMVIDLDRELSAKDTMLRARLSKCVLSEDGDALQVTCDKCGEKSIALLEDKYILITKEKCDEMNEEIEKKRLCNDAKVSLTTEGLKCECGGLHIAREENERMKKEISDMKSHIEALKNEIKERIEASKHDALVHENQISALRDKIENFLPAEPIKVADMLINAEEEYERNAIGKAFYGNDKGTYNLFDVSELRQIAEHLLVYCNAQKENGDE